MLFPRILLLLWSASFPTSRPLTQDMRRREKMLSAYFLLLFRVVCVDVVIFLVAAGSGRTNFPRKYTAPAAANCRPDDIQLAM